MNNAELLAQRWDRINKAINLEKPDRTPVILLYTLFAAKATGRPFSEFCSSIAKSAEIAIEAYKLCGDADGTDYLGFCTYGLSYLWLSKVKNPGRELPENVSYQVAESELMKVEDYDLILKNGFMPWFQDYMKNRVFNDAEPSMLPENQPPFDAKTVCDPLGIPVLTAGLPVPTPFDMLCGARSMTKFIRDLFTIPDKVEAVMKEMMPYAPGAAIEVGAQAGYKGVWIGGWRAASEVLAPRLWDRFVWPYYRELAQQAVDAGLIAICHLDSDWTRDLGRFKELPKKKCILATDGKTDIFKAKEVLGDHMCIMGDVPAAMFSVGTPDQVYEYATRLIRELGPEGFILHSGCDIPANAKLENVKAMVAAATGE